ncbi:MraY family glycosyltransferase [Clostridium folliculivorans]|uniref:Undecaprenyl-phosphate alpha-N-acetylglucosaminyl 1-phosphate transferase n=1 Tax=Clostridium folliculivorans TaxID=2886038 RepID=A0A9W6DAU2_9CLOT|nr:MraY family glycosyltransferase [Clostridium folliculivorans]GKU25589.1 undecaprenyl-phosphate alpha-N-acetylglucosaminyl 1-phosphate transferase [Clostridium folliculivorans]GKU28611.1 undecaprenyl-phosphate alpha-N-acetylglucosaminyl 1-phosphate transferase [Clostridium folliculivorans]
MFNYILGIVVSSLVAILITPSLMKIADKIEFTDKPTERKKHDKPIPIIGGIIMFIGFFIGYFLLVRNDRTQSLYLFVSSIMILLIGLLDDYFKTKGKEFMIFPRVLVQILAASLIYKSGIVFNGITDPFNGSYIELPVVLKYILTITWIFGVTTVINWSDGMDGLAGGISTISATTLFVVALAKGQTDSALMSIILVGAILGFLKYNRHPARIFMGDSGANFLGFTLAIIALDGAFKQATVMSIFIPFLALGVPIFDNLFVIFKRFSEGKPVYQADRSQIHYRLEQKGMNTRQVVSYICLISTCLSLISILILLLRL